MKSNYSVASQLNGIAAYIAARLPGEISRFFRLARALPVLYRAKTDDRNAVATHDGYAISQKVHLSTTGALPNSPS